MKRSLRMKFMLLLFALVVGIGNVWATPIEKISFSRSDKTDTYTSGYTFVAVAEGKSGYYQDGTGTERSLKLYHTSTKLFSSAPSSVTFTAKLGGGTTKDPLDNNVYVCFVDKDGNIIEGSSVVVTTKITNTSGSNFSVSMSTTKATDAYGVKIYHTKETSYNVRYYSFSLSYEEPAVSHILSSSVSPAASGTVTLGAATVAEGATTSATAAAAAGYKFKNWSISGTGASLSSTTDNPTTVTMGTADATVTATFEAVKTYAITYSVNGATNIVNVEENTAVDLSAPASSLIPVGYVFRGWRTSTLSETNTEPDDYITSATSTAAITYYAVIALANVNYITTHLTGDEIATNFAATAMSYSDSEKTYNDTDESMTWGARCITNASRHWIQLKSDNDVYIKAVAPQNITGVKVTISNASNLSGGVDDITKHGDFSGSVNLDKVQNTNAGACGTAASSAIVDRILTINADGTSKTIYIHVTGAARIWNVDVTYATIIASNFCTSVSSVTIANNTTISGDLNVNNYILTVPNSKTLTVSGTLTNQGTAANLVIEDGGQLILAKTNTGVAATVKKDVSAATAASKTDATYWYAISAGVANPSILDNTNLITETSTPYYYDLYRFNEEKNAGNAWENYRNASYSTSFTTLEKGRGYLYRNKSDLTITMTGDINVEDFEYDVTNTGTGEYAGFNLIGNPYTHDIYKGAGTAITSGTSTLSTGFYYLEPSTGKWAKGTDKSTAIAPNQGILVQVNATGNINMANTNSNGGGSKSNNDYIMLSVANSQYSDEAYAWFDKGIGLNKIEHRNSEIPMLYINQNDENFAIATMSDETQSFNLNFKAATMGKYTLSYKAKGEYNYLHVIDRLTGEDVDMLLDGEYSFIGAPNDNDNRFIVKLSYNANSNATDNDIFAYQSGSDIIVNGEGELQIFDVTGKKVATQHVNGVETINVQLQGVYIFKLNEKVQKIVVR